MVTDLTEYSTVQTWLNRLAPNTQKIQTSYFTKFMEWLHENGAEFKDYTPDQLIEYQKKTNGETQYDIVDLAQAYIRQNMGRASTKNMRYFNIRSFFSHNRAELPRDPGFRVRSSKPPVRGTLTPEDIKKNILSCNPAYQAAYLVMFQAALDQQMFLYWNNHGYE
ncbi:MAG: hypothetical protein ACOC6N_02850, partial [archaeon]